MFLRVGGLVTVLKPDLLMRVVPALVVAMLVALAFALVWMFWQQGDRSHYRSAEFRNPFDFLTVVGFALFLALIIVLGRAVGETFGATGAVAGAVVVGLADVDAVTVSMLRLTPGTLTAAQATLAILAAVASDTVSKIAIGAAIGRGWFAADLAALAAGCLAAGAAALWLTFTLMPA
jgi:uncharacterized membrane protein (DUF4010 family)